MTDRIVLEFRATGNGVEGTRRNLFIILFIIWLLFAIWVAWSRGLPFSLLLATIAQVHAMHLPTCRVHSHFIEFDTFRVRYMVSLTFGRKWRMRVSCWMVASRDYVDNETEMKSTTMLINILLFLFYFHSICIKQINNVQHCARPSNWT